MDLKKSQEFILGVFAKEIKLEDFNNEKRINFDYFIYNEKYFTFLIDLSNSNFLEDVEKVPDFFIKEFEKSSNKYLLLVFCPDYIKRNAKIGTKDYLHSKISICNKFLTKNNGDFLTDDEKISDDLLSSDDFSEIIKDLFVKLRIAHNEDIYTELITNTIQHEHLIPTLRPYQENAVKWMLKRELSIDYLQSEYIEVFTIPEYIEIIEHSKDIFFYNPITGDLILEKPVAIPIPLGGILADEMGLGKTVEVLDLILLHQKSKRKYEEISNGKLENNRKAVINENIKVDCICIRKSNNNLIECPKCFLHQHKECVLKYSNNILEELETYICPSCWKFEKPINSGSTIIVTPPILKKQWENEISKHTKNLKVFTYTGVKHGGWISPLVLSQYDIIITDYSVLALEIHYANLENNRHNFRHKSLYLRPVSPLIFVFWWRICMDEAQMVESTLSNAAAMARTLPAVYRWSITGTPIAKNINSLYGLLYFLGVEPFYSDNKIWKLSILNQFSAGNINPLLNVLKKIMWRTCKTSVINQINIPPQKEIIHYIEMSDIESLNYRLQHSQSAQSFQEKAIRIFSIYSSSNLHTQTIKLLMGPLVKLRQDCSCPSILKKTDSLKIKKILSPDQLLIHMISTNEVQCKEVLRNIVATLNGTAGIHIIKGEFQEAIKIYKSVLRRAKDNTGNICVDSLLQIHALHNLIEIINLDKNNEDYNKLNEYLNNCSALEWKYIESYYSLVRAINLQLEPIILSGIELKTKFTDCTGNWWREILYCENYSNYSIIEKIKLDLNEFSNLHIIPFNNVTGLDFVLTTWWDKINETRNNYLQGFKNLEYFYKNLKAKQEMDDVKQLNDINQLIENVYNCHLNKYKTPIEINKKFICDLCKLQKLLHEHECVIFDVIIKNDENKKNIRNRNPAIQEWTLKIICGIIKKDQTMNKILKMGELNLQLIEQYKTEVIEFAKLWVEINYTASAYDELTMCRLRMQIADPNTRLIDINRNRNIISENEIDMKMSEYIKDLSAYDTVLWKYMGRIKYLKHLEQTTDPGNCPICTKHLEEKYSVLQCGHYMCLSCLIQMKKYQPTHITCCVCRNKQKNKNVFYVTCKTMNNENDVIRGNYSSKIEKIVQTVIKLKTQDNNVKILIFSEWSDILNLIGEALNENSILFRQNGNMNSKKINEFLNPDLGVTCLLLTINLGSKGLNLIEATHVFFVEPILNVSFEHQAVGRVHRIGQTKETFVHRFIVKNTIEENIHKAINEDVNGIWRTKNIDFKNIERLFELNFEPIDEIN